MMINSALLHNCISGMSGFDFGINGKISVCDWAIINIMVAFSVSYKTTTICNELTAGDLFNYINYITKYFILFTKFLSQQHPTLPAHL